MDAQRRRELGPGLEVLAARERGLAEQVERPRDALVEPRRDRLGERAGQRGARAIAVTGVVQDRAAVEEVPHAGLGIAEPIELGLAVAAPPRALLVAGIAGRRAEPRRKHEVVAGARGLARIAA